MSGDLTRRTHVRLRRRVRWLLALLLTASAVAVTIAGGVAAETQNRPAPGWFLPLVLGLLLGALLAQPRPRP